VNPLYYNYHKVIINDCDGGAFSSSRGAVEVGGETIYMNGRGIVEAVFQELASAGLMDYKIALVSTNYASIGLTSWILDYVSEAYGVSLEAFVYSGFFFEYSGQYSSVMNPYDHEVFEGTYEEFWTSVIATHNLNFDSWTGVLTANLLAGVSERIMLIGSKYDPWQLTSAFGESYSDDMSDISTWVDELESQLDALIADNSLIYAAFSQCQFTGDVSVTKSPQDPTADVCEAYEPWENTLYQASAFSVEESITIGQGASSVSSLINLFSSNLWPSYYRLFKDNRGFGFSLCSDM
jgi:hypothetical protein